MGSELAAVSLPPTLPLMLPVGLKRSMVLTGKEKEKKSGRWGVVLASMGFNRGNVSMLKRKWLDVGRERRVVGAL